MVDPTTEEIAGWKVLRDAAQWAGLSGDPDQETSPIASLASLLGATADTPLRLVASISEDDYEEGESDDDSEYDNVEKD